MLDTAPSSSGLPERIGGGQSGEAADEGLHSYRQWPPLDSNPALTSIQADQALCYLHQSLVSLITLHDNLRTNQHQTALATPVIDDDLVSPDQAASPSAMFSKPKRPRPESFASQMDHSGARIATLSPESVREGQDSNDITPLDIDTRRASSVVTFEDDRTDSGSSGSVQGPSSETLFASPSGSTPTSNLEMRRRKSSSLLAEAAQVAALVLEAGELFNKPHWRLQRDPAFDSPELLLANTGSPGTMTPEQTPQEQKLAIARRFWSKSAPTISIYKYLVRLQKYCPTSTAVYLAAGLYIYRLCIILQTIPLTGLSVHRLVLAAIRVACKSLEDVNHSQSRFATAAGVSSNDLYRLEIALVFLLDFKLKVDAESLQNALQIWSEVEVQAKRSS